MVHVGLPYLDLARSAPSTRNGDAVSNDRSEKLGEYVPSDKKNWEAPTWILSSVGEVYFRMRDFPTALNRYQRAVQCLGGIGNPYIHLRLGQLYYETGNHDASVFTFAMTSRQGKNNE